MKVMQRNLIGMSMLFGLSSTFAAGEVVVKDCWLRQPIKGATVSAAYCRISNSGSEERRLLNVETPVAKTVELHTTVMNGDGMAMKRLPHFVLPPGGEVAMKPGGHHIMLFKLLPEMPKTAALTLLFDREERKTVEVPVLNEPLSEKVSQSHSTPTR